MKIVVYQKTFDEISLLTKTDEQLAFSTESFFSHCSRRHDLNFIISVQIDIK